MAGYDRYGIWNLNLHGIHVDPSGTWGSEVWTWSFGVVGNEHSMVDVVLRLLGSWVFQDGWWWWRAMVRSQASMKLRLEDSSRQSRDTHSVVSTAICAIWIDVS